MRRAIQVVMAALVLALTSACAAAAIGAAGAGAGIYLTSQGAEGVASENLAAVATRARTVLAAEGITLSGTETEGDEREFHGMKGDMEIHVELEARDGGGTMVRASARKSATEWDKEYARTLVQRITGG